MRNTKEADKERARKKKAFIKLLPKFGYHIGKTCKEIGINRQTYYQWCLKDDEFKERTHEQFEYDVDDSEEKIRLLRQGLPRFDENGKFVGWIEKPHFGALLAHLKAKGGQRGYGDKLEITDDRLDKERAMSDEELYAEIMKMKESYFDDENTDDEKPDETES